MDIGISVNNLKKSYGNNLVIKGISFEVHKGEIFALLGTNGAGKTTTLECIEGLRSYEDGSIKVFGKIGVQLQSTSLPENIKAIEAFRLFCKWNNVETDEELFNSFGLKDLSNKQYKEMSTGQKRRLHLALSLIGNPDIIFLDEPTAGLDVEGRVSLHEEIRKLKKSGKTIIMASHDMAEVEDLCDRIAIIKDGDIAFIGSSSELTNRNKKQSKVYIKTANPIKDAMYEKDYAVFVSEDISETLLTQLNLCKEESNTVLDIKIERDSLEQKFIELAKGDK